jgi:hypothetical protein
MEQLKRLPLVRGMSKTHVPTKVLLIRLFAATLYWFAGYFANIASATIAGKRFEKGKPVLDDIGMLLLPKIPYWWSDAWFLLWVPFCLIKLVLVSENGLSILIRNLVIYGTALGVRGFFLNLSLLPDPNPECLHFEPHVQMYSPFELTCGDMMYSGHTALWVILTCCWLKYGTSLWDRIIGVLGTLIGMVILVAARSHYTLDVAVGAVMGSMIWLSYYTFTRNVVWPDYRTNSFFWFFEEHLARDDNKFTKEEELLPQSPKQITIIHT